MPDAAADAGSYFTQLWSTFSMLSRCKSDCLSSRPLSSIGRHALRSCSVIQDMIGVVGMGERDVMK